MVLSGINFKDKSKTLIIEMVDNIEEYVGRKKLKANLLSSDYTLEKLEKNLYKEKLDDTVSYLASSSDRIEFEKDSRFCIEAKEVYIRGVSFRGLHDTFMSSKIGRLELSDIELKDTHAALGVFYKSNIKELIINSIEANDLVRADSVFGHSTIEELKIEGLRAPKLSRLIGTFAYSDIPKMKINLSNIEEANGIFNGSNIDEVELVGRDKGVINRLDYGFYGVDLRELDLSGVRISDNANLQSVFRNSTIHQLTLDNIQFTPNQNLKDMLKDSKIRVISLVGVKRIDLIPLHSIVNLQNIVIIVGTKEDKEYIESRYGVRRVEVK